MVNRVSAPEFSTSERSEQRDAVINQSHIWLVERSQHAAKRLLCDKTKKICSGRLGGGEGFARG